MKILHTVEFYSPSVGGAQEVVKQISEHLVKRGHTVTVATTKLAKRTSYTVNGVQIEEFDIAGNAVGGFRGDTARYQQFLTDSHFDVMMNYAAQQWATDLVFPVLDRIPYRKVLAPCGFSGLLNTQYSKYFEQLPDIMRRYDHLIFHSDTYRDIEFARKQGISHCTVIPNGASEEEFNHVDSTFRQRYRISEDVPLLLTVGSHTGRKGHRLAIEAFRRARIGQAVLVIIGNTIGGRGCLPECKIRAVWAKLFSLGHKHVLLLNPPRPDVVAAYHAADLFVFGSNIECSPLVLFEAMASKTPFVTVACGNAEEIVNWSHGGILLPTIRKPNGLVNGKPESMARAIEDLIKNPEERHRLAEAGYQAWQEHFTWDKIAVNYEKLYQSLVEKSERA
jgi:glycosyltransferase involved in cell wall biosynthesis